jgi:hypothetical protein
VAKRNDERAFDLTLEEEAAAERIYEALKDKVQQQVKQMVRAMAAKKPEEMLGRGEFELRDMALELGATVLQTALNESVKKGGLSGC